MRLTKDEARILAEALDEAKYDINDKAITHIPQLFGNLEMLQKKLEEFGKDKRRKGRTSMDDWHDLIKRFSKAYSK